MANNVNLTFGEQIMRGRIRENTHKMYASKVQVLKLWLIAKYSHLIQNDEITLPISTSILIEFMGHISVKIDKATQLPYNPPVLNSHSHVQGFRSAIIDLYKTRGLTISDMAKSQLTDFVSGYAKRVAQAKEDGDMPMVEGKSPMSTVGYHFLANKAVTQDEDFNLCTFVHVFLLLCWNLMARSVSVAHILYEHIGWEEDALTITIGKTKGDQEGKNTFPRHIYANPAQPEICPILALAIYVFCKGYQREGSATLVFGTSGQDRFSKWLRNICQKHNDGITSFGFVIEDIGTNSFRKDLATILANKPGLTAINIWL
jgi:hypothetical protein